MSNPKGYKDRPDSKFQPASLEKRDANYMGSGHDFNTKGKITSNSDSDYHNLGGKNSGLHGNFAEKDASLDYLRNRNKQGQQVQHFSATSRESVLKTMGGSTAYDPMPIPEVYHPATSQGPVPPDAVEYKTDKKDRHEELPYTQDTESNKLTRKIVKHLETKG